MADWFDDQPGAGGIPAGPRLKASLFLPNGKGLVYIDSDGGFWQTQLVKNADGTATLKLVPVDF